MTQHREPNLVSASSLGCSMMKCLAPPLKISYAELLSWAKVERRKRILLRFNFMFVVFTCLLQKGSDQRGIVISFPVIKLSLQDGDIALYECDIAHRKGGICLVSPNGMIDEENQTFFFFSFGENVFKFSLIKTSEGNLDPLKFPLKKNIKWSSFIQNTFWSSLYFRVLCACHLVCAALSKQYLQRYARLNKRSHSDLATHKRVDTLLQ